MIGDYGAISPGDPVTVMLVSSAARRVHRVGGRVTSFSGSVDNAERAYVRTKPGLLAIGPAADGKHSAEVMTRAKTTPTFREGGLVRVAWGHPQSLPLPMPRGVTAVRVWINDRGGRDLVLAAEGDYPGAEAAQAAAQKSGQLPQSRAILTPGVEVGCRRASRNGARAKGVGVRNRGKRRFPAEVAAFHYRPIQRAGGNATTEAAGVRHAPACCAASVWFRERPAPRSR